MQTNNEIMAVCYSQINISQLYKHAAYLFILYILIHIQPAFRYEYWNLNIFFENCYSQGWRYNVCVSKSTFFLLFFLNNGKQKSHSHSSIFGFFQWNKNFEQWTAKHKSDIVNKIFIGNIFFKKNLIHSIDLRC